MRASQQKSEVRNHRSSLWRAKLTVAASAGNARTTAVPTEEPSQHHAMTLALRWERRRRRRGCRHVVIGVLMVSILFSRIAVLLDRFLTNVLALVPNSSSFRDLAAVCLDMPCRRGLKDHHSLNIQSADCPSAFHPVGNHNAVLAESRISALECGLKHHG